ncbi:BsuPI-related putative proteinase inhibitor [Shewanella sp. GXUN23E]|uniref:BsuPI-related putative proteinase inhibitor n=1 Tax=Shewanella sp. GXUN23E TaxID=3422498 RepID=UPI003D7ECD38
MSTTRIGMVLATAVFALGGCHAQSDALADKPQSPLSRQSQAQSDDAARQQQQPGRSGSTEIRQLDKNEGVRQALTMPEHPDSPGGQQTMVSDAMAKDTLLTGQLQISDKPSARGLTVIQLLISNPQSHGVPMQFNSGMTGDLWLMSAKGERLWAWSDDMMFTQALREVTLASGKTMTVNFDIPAKVMERVRPGDYWQASLTGHNTESSRPLLMPQTLAIK